MEYHFTPKGVCSKQFHAVVNEDGVIESLTIEDGCSGYGNGMSRLAPGMHIDDIIERLSGVRCGRKMTSCPDQLAQMMTEIKKQLAGTRKINSGQES